MFPRFVTSEIVGASRRFRSFSLPNLTSFAAIATTPTFENVQTKFANDEYKLYAEKVKNASYGIRRMATTATTTTTNTTIKAYENKHNQNAIQFLQKVRDNRIQPGIVAQKVQEILLQLLSNESAITEEDGPLALELLRVGLDNNTQKRQKLSPRLFSLAMQVMVKCGHPLAPNEIHRLMWQLLNNRTIFFTEDLLYNTNHVNDAFCQLVQSHIAPSSSTSKYRKKFDYNTRKRLDAIVNQMKQFWENPDVPLVANATAINMLIRYLCRQQKASQAYELLQWMVHHGKNHPVELEPLVSSFTLVISTLGKAGKLEKAQEILQWMLSSYRSQQLTLPPPNKTCFNALLDAWAKSGRDDAGVKAEQVLEWMQDLYEGEGLDTRPDEISYNTCTNAWAQSKSGKHSAARAEMVLRRMIDMHESGSDIGPTSEAFTSVMNAWARSKTDDAPFKVAALLSVMDETSKTSKRFDMDPIPYSILISAWERLAHRKLRDDQKRQYSDEVLHVLEQMKQRGVTPNSVTHNATIIALTRIWPPHGIHYFLELEMQFRDGLVEMDTTTFNSGLSAIAAMDKPDAAEQAMTVLQRMLEYSKIDNGVHADEISFNIILKVLSRSRSKNAASRANQLLLEMDEMRTVKPCSISYLTCIIAWGRSEDSNKFDHIKLLLSHYQDTYEKGRLTRRFSVSPYNAALSACFHNTTPQIRLEALDTALHTMTKVREIKGVYPDQTTYLSLFRAIASLAEDNHLDSMMQKEFNNCILDGIVCHELLDVVYEASPITFQNFLGTGLTPDEVTIPKSWSKNVKQSARRARRSVLASNTNYR